MTEPMFYILVEREGNPHTPNDPWYNVWFGTDNPAEPKVTKEPPASPNELIGRSGSLTIANSIAQRVYDVISKSGVNVGLYKFSVPAPRKEIFVVVEHTHRPDPYFIITLSTFNPLVDPQGFKKAKNVSVSKMNIGQHAATRSQEVAALLAESDAKVSIVNFEWRKEVEQVKA